MRFSKSVAACAVTLTTFAVAAAVGAGPVLAGVANPPPAPPLTFPTIQLDTEPSGVAVDPTTHMVYVANPQNDGNGLVSVIDAADDFSPPVLLEQLPVPGDPTAIGVDTSTHIVYAAGNNGLTMINGATIPPTVGSTIPLGGDQDLPGQVAVDSATHTVYVTEFGANDVKVVNTAVNPPTVTTIGYPEIVDTPLGVAVDPTTHLAYVTEINDDLLAVIDGADNPPQVVHTIHLGDPATINNGGADPDAVGVDPTTHTVYVSNGNGTAQIINGYEITGGPHSRTAYPDGVAVDPTTHTAYVTDGAANTLSVVSDTKNPPAVTATLPLGDFPLGIGIDPSTHTVFIANHSRHHHLRRRPAHDHRHTAGQLLAGGHTRAAVHDDRACLRRRRHLQLDGGQPTRRSFHQPHHRHHQRLPRRSWHIPSDRQCHGPSGRGEQYLLPCDSQPTQGDPLRARQMHMTGCRQMHMTG